MPIDYIVASLPTLAFDAPAPISMERFREISGWDGELPHQWTDLETEMRNVMAEARKGAKYVRPAEGCSLYWRNRVGECFQEKDVLKRDELLDRVWWDAAGELTPVTSPLSKGAIFTYAVRLGIAIKRSMISKDKGNEAFDRLTAETKR